MPMPVSVISTRSQSDRLLPLRSSDSDCRATTFVPTVSKPSVPMASDRVEQQVHKSLFELVIVPAQRIGRSLEAALERNQVSFDPVLNQRSECSSSSCRRISEYEGLSGPANFSIRLTIESTRFISRRTVPASSASGFCSSRRPTNVVTGTSAFFIS